MIRKKKPNSKSRSLQIETLNHRIMLDGAGFIDPVFYGPTPYLSEADTPAGFVPVPDCDECVVGLETFEDDSLDFGLQISQGQIIGPGFGTGTEFLTDSVDGDDGVIDGTGQSNNMGYSYFTFGNSITVTLPSLMQSAGLVWTDGDPTLTDVVFEAFDENGNSIGTINAGPIADASIMGTTPEDRFFGVSYGDGVTTGVTSISITNVGGRGIEIDHIQFANCSACCYIDLELTKSVDVAIVEEGDVVTWTIDITNNPETASLAATGVQIEDVLPAGLTIVGASITNGSIVPGTGIWTLSGPLEPGETETLTIITTVDSGLASGTMLINTAQVIAADQPDIDSTPDNDDGDQSEDDEDSAKVTVFVPSQELLMLSGHSYVDTNDDGIFQSYELPLMGVEVQLMGTDLFGNAVNLATFTNIDGFYKFNDLQPGTYMVKQSQPVQFVDGKDTVGNLGGDDSVNDEFTVELDSNGEEYNFGELGLRPEYVNKRLYLTSTPYTNWQYIDVRQSSIWYSFDVDHRSFLNVYGVVNDGNVTVEIFDANMNLVETRAFGVLGQSADEPFLLQDGGQHYMRVQGDSVLESLSLEIVTPSVSVNGNQLIAVGTAGDDDIHLHLGETQHVLSINGLTYEFDANTVTDLHVGASSGHDSVTIVGTHLNETSSVIGASGKLSSSDYSVHTYSFDRTTFVGGGGYDYSQVYGSLGNDNLSALPGDTKLTTPDNVMQVLGYDRVDAYGRGGWDYASLYGTNAADSFVANEQSSVLQGVGHHAVAKGFDRVDAFGRGGNDTAWLYDSTGNDTFVSTKNYALLSTSSRLNYLKGFEHNTAIFNNGGTDTARFTDLEQDDQLFGEGDFAKAIIAAGGRDDRAVHVDHLFASGDDFQVDVDDFDGSVTINN